MQSVSNPELDDLYERGVAAFGAGNWREAIEIFERLMQQLGPQAELEALTADARLKLEYERIFALQNAQPKRAPQRRRWMLGAAVVTPLLAAGLAWAFFLRPIPEPASIPVIQAIGLDATSPAATQAAQIAVVPAVATTAPTQPAETGTGTLLVRMAENQSITQSVPNLYIILDASGSMLGTIGSDRKIDIAHRSLATLVDQLPADINVGLRSYGHRRSQDCSDVELIAPLGPLDRTTLVTQINNVVPVDRSYSPIGLSLQQIPTDLAGLDQEVLVVLVSDGDETCDSAPEQVAAELHAANPRLRISVIGFNIGPVEWRSRLEAIARNGGGEYFEANDAIQLASALQQAIIPTYRIYNSAGDEVLNAELDVPQSLPVGSYQMVLEANPPFELELSVNPNQTTLVELNQEQDLLSAEIHVADNLP